MNRRRLVVMVLMVLVVASGCQPRWQFAIVGDSVTKHSRIELALRGGEVWAFGGVDIRHGRPWIREARRVGYERLVIALGRIDVGRDHRPLRVIRRRILAVLRHDIGGVDCVIWLDLGTHPNLHPGWPERAARFNAILEEVAPRYGVRVAHWSAVEPWHPEWFLADGVHLTIAGKAGYARFVKRSTRLLC